MPAGSRPTLSLSRYTLAGALVVAAIVGVLIVVAGGSGSGARGRRTLDTARGRAPLARHDATPAGGAGALAGAGATAGTRPLHVGAPKSGATSQASGVSIGPDGDATVSEVRDPEEANSFPEPSTVHHRSASTPSVAGEAAVADGAASDAEIRKELGEEEHAKAQERAARHRILTPQSGGFSVGGDGTIPIPTNAPEVVQRVVAGGNAIADFPYIWGGGHGSFVANGYDCSGSVSYALAAGGLLRQPLVSGDLAAWGDPGPGQWITIYANAGHTFMDVAGMWFDTAGRSGPFASRWLVAQPSLAGYAVRHPPGL